MENDNPSVTTSRDTSLYTRQAGGTASTPYLSEKLTLSNFSDKYTNNPLTFQNCVLYYVQGDGFGEQSAE